MAKENIILFLAQDGVALKEWLPVAKYLSKTPTTKPVFLVTETCPLVWTQRLDQEKISWQFLKTIPRLRRFPGFSIASAFFEFRKYRKEAQKMVQAIQPSALILLSDRLVGWGTAFVNAMNEKKRPSFIIPGAFPMAAGAEANTRQRSVNFRAVFSLEPFFNRLIVKCFPQWVYVYNGIPTLFYPTSDAIAAKLLGLMPDRPWALGGGNATQMLVECEAARDIFFDAGTPAEKMVIKGRPTADDVFERMSNVNAVSIAVREKYGLSSTDRIVLCSVPHLKEHNLLSVSDHWAEMEFLFSSLSAVGSTRVLLNLHPGCNPDEYRSVAQKHGAILCTGVDINEFIPACDVYVSSYSTTANFAMGCGKPIIVVDFYKLNYPVYDGCRGVKLVRKHEELVPLLTRFLNDKDYRDAFLREQKIDAPRWVLFDGRNTERVVNEILSKVS